MNAPDKIEPNRTDDLMQPHPPRSPSLQKAYNFWIFECRNSKLDRFRTARAARTSRQARLARETRKPRPSREVETPRETRKFKETRTYKKQSRPLQAALNEFQ